MSSYSIGGRGAKAGKVGLSAAIRKGRFPAVRSGRPVMLSSPLCLDRWAAEQKAAILSIAGHGSAAPTVTCPRSMNPRKEHCVTGAIELCLRFTEGDIPGCNDQSSSKMGFRNVSRLIAGFGQQDRQRAREMAPHLPYARLERLAGHGRPDEPTGVFGQCYELMILLDNFMRQSTCRFDR